MRNLRVLLFLAPTLLAAATGTVTETVGPSRERIVTDPSFAPSITPKTPLSPCVGVKDSSPNVPSGLSASTTRTAP